MKHNSQNAHRLVIIGASGQGKVVAEIARLNGYKEIVFLDDNEAAVECGGYPVIGKTDYSDIADSHVFVAIGNPVIREKLFLKYSNYYTPTLIHPNAVISDNAVIGRGTVVMAGAVINPFAVVGNACIVNTSSSIDHDCVVSDYVHIAVGAHVCGTVSIGTRSWIGAGVTIINNINICQDCMIGAGAVVTDSIAHPGTYIGIPARIRRSE